MSGAGDGSGPDAAAVDTFISERLLPAEPAFEDLLRAARDAGLPAADVSPLQGRLLELLARMQRAERILEVGTLAGYSTLWLARSGARVVTLEIDARHAEVARANLDRAGVGEAVEIVVDNVVRGGALADPADDEPRVVGSRRVVEAIAAEPRLLATGLQTVGVKGWDGMLLALVV